MTDRTILQSEKDFPIPVHTCTKKKIAIYDTAILPNEIRLRTQIKEKILFIDSEEVIP